MNYLIFISILCLVYGLFIYITGSKSPFFFFWILLSLIFFVVSTSQFKLIWQAFPLFVQLIILFLITLIIALFSVIISLIINNFINNTPGNVDYLIVLGAWVKKDGQLSHSLQERLKVALIYLLNNSKTKCIVTGGKGFNEPISEAYAMYNYLTSHGIQSERIIVEENSTSTKENLLYSNNIVNLHNKSISIVTNNYHVFRAKKIAKKLGFEEVYGLPAKTPFGYLTHSILREAFAIIKEKLISNI